MGVFLIRNSGGLGFLLFVPLLPKEGDAHRQTEQAPEAEQPQTNEHGYQGVSHDQAMVFYDQLMKHGIRATIRKEHGADIDAACGQLRAKELKKEGKL